MKAVTTPTEQSAANFQVSAAATSASLAIALIELLRGDAFAAGMLTASAAYFGYAAINQQGFEKSKAQAAALGQGALSTGYNAGAYLYQAATNCAKSKQQQKTEAIVQATNDAPKPSM